jgi:serine protease Do
MPFFRPPKMMLRPSNALAVLAALVGLVAPPVLVADEPVSPDGAFAEAIQIAQRRTVKIYGAGIGRSPAYASGILVSSTGDVLTGNGVYLGAENLRITLPDGTSYPATVVRRSPTLQIARLKIAANTADFFDFPSKPAAGKGDWILAVSNAFKVADHAEPLSVNIGVLSLRTQLAARRGVNDFPYEGDVILYDAITSNPGAAGGAVVNTEGKLVGMIGRVIESKSTNTRLNYAVPAETLQQFMSGEEPAPMVAETPTTAAKGELGIRLFNLGGRKSPAFIDRVLPGSPAAKAGLKTDDMVISMGGEIVRDAGDFKRLADRLSAGLEITLEVKRKNDLLTIKLTPVEAK